MRMMDGTHKLWDMARSKPVATSRRQAGAATLAAAVIMLLVVSVLVFHSHTAGWLEQRATANQARAKQAHAAAEAGLEAALAALNADSGTPRRDQHLRYVSDRTFESKDVPLTGSPSAGLSYSVTFSAASPAPANTFSLTSTGGSDCTDTNALNSCSGQATVRQVVQLLPSLPAVSVYSSSAFENKDAFFERFFGASKAEIKALTTPVPGPNITVSTQGLVWLEGASPFTANGDVGSEMSPVLLVVIGDLTLNSNKAWGFVYVTGQLNCSNCDIRGAVAVEGGIDMPEKVTSGTAILDRLGYVAPRFAKVMGTWRDW
jgi:hypothetical protein